MTETGPTTGGQAPPLQAVLAADARARRRRLATWFVLLLTIAAVGVWYRFGRPKQHAVGPAYTTQNVEVGTLVVRVVATGNLQPTNQVEIGSEISGIVTDVLVDANDRVTRDQVLLQIDTTRLEAAAATSRASLLVAQAQVEQARATLDEANIALARLEELFRLSEGRSPAQSDLDAATASVRRAEASLGAARASVTQARAAVESDAANLEKATIRSPIDGVVLIRAVEPGQTVAATFQAPVLLTIAEDLGQMELEVAIDEADVGQVAVGQHATFTVDAWPGRSYEGDIVRVGLGAQELDGVVSYPALIAVHNDDLSLRPGMTATAEIVTVTREGALLVPNAALRFDPEIGVASRPSSQSGLMGQIMMRPSAPSGPATARLSAGRRVWVLRDGAPVEVEVEPGLSNGQATEIAPGPIGAGTPVIVELAGTTR